MKRPAFQFYPADWVKDPALRSCSLAARGLWMEMMCVAHESEQYGYLVVNGAPIPDKQILAGIGGATMKLLGELETAGVFSRDKRGAIYSRRMVKDERLRRARAAAGKLGAEFGELGKEYGAMGGRPKNETGQKPPSDDVEEPPIEPPLTPGQKPPPSSSSSSSSKSEVGVPPPTVAPVDNSVSKVKFANENNEIQPQKLTPGQQWDNPAWVAATAKTVGKKHLPGEEFDAFRDRVWGALQAKLADAKRVTR